MGRIWSSAATRETAVADAADGGSVVDGEIAADETVTASQFNTIIMLSANTIEDMFGSSSESDIEETASPVNDIADASRVSVGDDSSDTADDIPSVDGESGLSVEDRESTEDDDRVVVAASDVNVLAADEPSEGYELAVLDESDESDSSGEEAIPRREYPSSADDSEEVAVGMDAAFIQTFGGHLALDAINMEALRGMEWSAPSSEFESGRSEYPGLSCDSVSYKI
ncbi:hypothetical protein PInf_018896 [Phytophthora infestans]|nr:hypothetical protein PInf_018896 [Phytophthora infestans]